MQNLFKMSKKSINLSKKFTSIENNLTTESPNNYSSQKNGSNHDINFYGKNNLSR